VSSEPFHYAIEARDYTRLTLARLSSAFLDSLLLSVQFRMNACSYLLNRRYAFGDVDSKGMRFRLIAYSNAGICQLHEVTSLPAICITRVNL
jgi:hypothetical protein